MMLLSFRRAHPLRPLLAAAALGCVLVAAPAFAQEPSPSQLAAARELIVQTGALATIDEMLPSYGEQIKKQAVTRPELGKDLDEVLKSLQPELNLQRQQILNVVSRTYAKFMTEAEMNDAIAFFKTPSGAKYIKVQPVLVEDIVTDVSGWSDQVSEYVITRVRAEMAKRGHQMQ